MLQRGREPEKLNRPPPPCVCGTTMCARCIAGLTFQPDQAVHQGVGGRVHGRRGVALRVLRAPVPKGCRVS